MFSSLQPDDYARCFAYQRQGNWNLATSGVVKKWSGDGSSYLWRSDSGVWMILVWTEGEKQWVFTCFHLFSLPDHFPTAQNKDVYRFVMVCGWVTPPRNFRSPPIHPWSVPIKCFTWLQEVTANHYADQNHSWRLVNSMFFFMFLVARSGRFIPTHSSSAKVVLPSPLNELEQKWFHKGHKAGRNRMKYPLVN